MDQKVTKEDVIEIEDSPKKPKRSGSHTHSKKRKRSKRDEPPKKKQKTSSAATKFQIPKFFTNHNSSQSSTPSPTSSNQVISPSSSFSSETNLWIEKYQPKTESELPVHKKKLTEVKEWLNKTLLHLPLGTPNTPRLLILTGPTGACKTTLVQVLCRELHSELCEWIDPSMCLWKDSNGKI